MESVFLGVIAAATALMAVLQVGAVVVLIRLVRRLEQSVGQLQRDVQPLIAQATTVSEEAARVATLVSAQVERADGLLNDLARRVDDTVTLVQTAVVAPAREGLAIAAAVRAALSALRGLRRSGGSSGRHDEEDALFIG